MHPLKALNQQNKLLALTLYITISSIVWGCEQCKPKTLQEEKFSIKVTPATDIQQNEIGTIRFQKKTGHAAFSEVTVMFTDYANFIQEDGTKLPPTSKLSTLLGKPELEPIDNTKLELKVKIIPERAKMNLDTQLKICLGNSEDVSAYVRDMVAITWKASPLTFKLDDPIINSANKTATLKIIKGAGTNPLKYGEVYLTFSALGAGANLNHFQLSGGNTLNSGTLDSFLTGITATDTIPDSTPIEINIEGIVGGVLQGEKLSLAIGKSVTDTTCYVPVTSIVTWQDRLQITSSGSADIIGPQVAVCKFKNASTCKLRHGQLKLISTGDSDFFQGGSVADLTAEPTLETIVGPGDIAIGSDFSISLKPKTAATAALLTPKLSEILSQAKVIAKTATTGANMAAEAAQAIIDAAAAGSPKQIAAAQVIQNAILVVATAIGVGINSADETTRNAAIDQAISNVFPINPLLNFSILLDVAAERVQSDGVNVKKTLTIQIIDAVDPTIVYMQPTQIITWSLT